MISRRRARPELSLACSVVELLTRGESLWRLLEQQPRLDLEVGVSMCAHREWMPILLLETGASFREGVATDTEAVKRIRKAAYAKNIKGID